MSVLYEQVLRKGTCQPMDKVPYSFIWTLSPETEPTASRGRHGRNLQGAYAQFEPTLGGKSSNTASKAES